MTLQEITKILQEKQENLTARITAIEADFKKGRSQDFAEQTTESENDEVLDNIHYEAKAELQRVKEALIRIKEDCYGKCSECNAPILSERLSALPYTTVCINCAH